MKQATRLFAAQLLGGVAICALSTSALAQSSGDEIIVTATKRAESLQDVPLAVTAVSDEKLQRQGIRDIGSLQRASSTFNMNSTQSETQGTTIRIRGVGTTGNNIGLESAVGVFLDGVYLSRPGVALADLADLQQIEIIRGPQGTLFGRNTSAGALNITSKKPNLSEIEGFANATFGNFDLANFQGGVSFPLIQDELALRLTGATRNRDGISTSPSGSESNTRDRYLARAQLLWEPSDSFSLRLIGDLSDADEECCDTVWMRDTPLATTGPGAFTLVGLGATGGAPNSGPSALADRLTNSTGFENGADQWGFSAEMNYKLGDAATLTYIGAYRDFVANATQDLDFSLLNAVSSPFISDDIKMMTHELRLQGEAGRLDWLVGGFLSDEEIEENFVVTLGPDFQRMISANIILAPGVFPGFGANPMLTFAGGANANGNFAHNLFTQDSNSWSIFTHNVLKITDWFDLTAGVRYVSEEKDGAFEQIAANSSACQGVLANIASVPVSLRTAALGLTCFPFSTRANLPQSAALALPRTYADTFEDEELIYTVVGNFTLSDNVSVYGGYTHGFKSGGFNLDSTAAVASAPGVFADPRFRSEEVNSYEIGLKAVLANGRLRANLAGFHMEMTDFQVLEFTGVQFNTFNVPKALSTGAEAEIMLEVADWLTLNADMTYANSRYPDDCNNGALTPPSVANLCGFRLSNAPKFVGVFGGTFETPVSASGWTMFATASARLETERRTSTPPRFPVLTGPLNPFEIQPGNTKIDARLGFSAPDDRWGIELWSNNLTDKQTRFVTFNIPLRGTGVNAARGGFIEEPRTWGVTVRAKF